MSGTPALSVKDLHVRYGSTMALRGVDLEVAAGGCTAVLGPSGCGKSTLLRTVAGLVESQAGTIRIGDELTNEGTTSRVPPESRRSALVFQDLALWPHMTVEGNLDFVLEGRGVPRGKRRAVAEAACASVGLPMHFFERRPAELSGGERQRAALARAIAQEPRLLLLDEPLTGLDRHLRRHLLETLASLRAERGLAMLVVTHDQEEAFALADRVAVMSAGVIEQEGTPVEVYTRPRTAFVAGFVGPAALLASRVTAQSADTPLGRFEIGDGAVGEGERLAVFRPESVHISNGEGGCRGTIERSFYRGGHYLLVVSVGGVDERVLVRSETEVAPGTEIALKADVPAFVLPEGGRSEAS